MAIEDRDMYRITGRYHEQLSERLVRERRGGASEGTVREDEGNMFKVELLEESVEFVGVDMKVPFQEAQEGKFHAGHLLDGPHVTRGSNQLLGRQAVVVVVFRRKQQTRRKYPMGCLRLSFVI